MALNGSFHTTPNGWLKMDHTIEVDDLQFPLFQETSLLVQDRLPCGLALRRCELGRRRRVVASDPATLRRCDVASLGGVFA